MRGNPVELLTVINPGYPSDSDNRWWRGHVQLGYSREDNQLIGEALPRGEARKLAEWWNENFQPQGFHVHHFLRLNEAYSRGGKRFYDVVREVVQKNPEQSEAIEPKGGWTMDRFKNFLVASAIGGVGYSLYRSRMRAATTGEEAQSASRDYFLFGIGSALLLYLVYGDKLKEMVPQRPRRNSDDDDIDWVVKEDQGETTWTAYLYGVTKIGEVIKQPGERQYKYRLKNGFWSGASSLEKAKKELIDDYRGELAIEEDHMFFDDFDENPRKLRLSDLEFDYGQGCGVEGCDAYAGDEFIGEIAAYEDEDGYHYRLADEWAWIPADSLNEAKRGLVDEYNMDMLEEHWLGEENKLSRYFVRLPDEGVSYPKKGSDYYPEGYPLKKALDFARIGSQKGGPREVYRDRRGGKKIRTYKRGKRTWPRTKGQARNLLPAEVPTRLRAS